MKTFYLLKNSWTKKAIPKVLQNLFVPTTNVMRTTKKTPLTTFMKDEEWRLFLSFLFKSDKFSDFFDIAG
jgi:hypothetical protein